MTTYSTHTVPALAYAAPVEMGDDDTDVLGVERPQTVIRHAVEVLFYLCAANAVFGSYTGTISIPFITGAAIDVAGMVALIAVLAQRDPIPLNVWGALAMLVGANVSRSLGNGVTPLFGSGLPAFLHFVSNALMISFIVQNEAARKRLLLFCGVVVTASVAVGGVSVGRIKKGRLELEDVAGMFSNANDLAYVAGLFAVALLFWSLRSSKLMWLVLWPLAAALSAAVLSTVSRGGVLALGAGLAMLVLTIVTGKGVRASGFILLFVIGVGGLVAAGSQLASSLSDPVEQLGRRLGEESSRTAVYSLGTLRDLWHTKFFGVGHEHAIVSEAGIEAHNSFIYTHMAYGGVTAWPYAVWWLIVVTRVWRATFSPGLPRYVKLEVICMLGMAFASQLMSNQAYAFYSSIYAMAMIDKYTMPFSRRRAAARREAQMATAWPAAVYADGVGVAAAGRA